MLVLITVPLISIEDPSTQLTDTRISEMKAEGAHSIWKGIVGPFILAFVAVPAQGM